MAQNETAFSFSHFLCGSLGAIVGMGFLLGAQTITNGFLARDARIHDNNQETQATIRGIEESLRTDGLVNTERQAWNALAIALDSGDNGDGFGDNDGICKLKDYWKVRDLFKDPLRPACEMPDRDVFVFRVYLTEKTRSPWKFEFVPTAAR